VVSFYFLKSRKRFWIPDGIDSFVTIIPPKDADKIYTKDLNEDEATRRLSYLADLVDTHGWAIRGIDGAQDTSISADLYYESQQVPDMMDNSTPAAQALNQQLSAGADARRQEAVANMQAAAKAPAANTPTTSTPVAAKPVEEPKSSLPSVAEIRTKQTVTENKQAKKDVKDAIALANALTEEASDDRHVPIAKSTPASTPENAASSTSASTPDAGTMVLTQKQANELSEQKGVSLETLSKQANRVAAQNKALKDGDEVTISFH
jgi:hypothetical protein